MSDYQVELIELPKQPAAVVLGHVTVAELPGFLSSAFGEVIGAVAAQGLQVTGPPFGRYLPTGDGFDAEVGFPTSGPVAASGRVQPVDLPAGPAARVLHRGAYAAVGAAYQAAYRWLAEQGYVPDVNSYECYLDEPDVPEPRTMVYVPCRRATG